MYELKNGAGYVKFSDPFPVFESEYINGKKMEKESHLIFMANENLKENI